MDRLTATSMAPPPDWPLPSLPLSSLVNVPKENKRHCRLFPAGMVHLNLTQMADHEGRKDYPEGQKKLDYKKVEFTEHEFEKWVFERRRMQKMEKMQEKKKRIVEPNSFDEMIDAVDALMSSLISPTETMEPPKTSKVAAEIEKSHFPTTQVIEIAELDARETAIATTPSPTETDNSNNNKSLIPEEVPSPTTHPISLTTALHSNPPTAPERAFARNLSSAHHARMMTANAIRSSEGMKGQSNSLAAFDAATEYGKGVKKTTKMSSFGGAVQKGFRGVFGQERCW